MFSAPGITNKQEVGAAGVGLVAPVTQTVNVFVFAENNAAEQTLVTVAIANRSVVGGIWLDMTNVTQATTISLYHQIDGVNYRKYQENAWIVADDDGVLIDGFTAYRNIRITLQCGGAGIGNVNVPYAVV